MSKRTLSLIIVLILLVVVLLSLAIGKTSTPPPPIPTRPIATPTPKVEQTSLLFGDLTIAPSSPSASSKKEPPYSLPINIKTGSNAVTAVQLELLYDPKAITKVVVKPESFFANPTVLINNIDAQNGRISYALGIGPDASGTQGTGTVASISFAAKSKTPIETSISFLPKTLVTAEGVSQSVLKTTNTANFIIGQIPQPLNIQK